MVVILCCSARGLFRLSAWMWTWDFPRQANIAGCRRVWWWSWWSFLWIASHDWGVQTSCYFIENVKNMVGPLTMAILSKLKPWLRTTTSSSGRFSAGRNFWKYPWNRERIYIVGFDTREPTTCEFPEESSWQHLSWCCDFGAWSLMGPTIIEKASKNFYDQLKFEVTSQDTVYQWRRQYVRENKNSVVPTLTLLTWNRWT